MIINLSLAIISALFLVLAIQIETTSEDLWGPKIAPLFLAGTLLILSIVASLGPIIRKGARETDEEVDQENSGEGPVPFFKIALVLILGVFYFFAISVLGYLISTIISLFLILLIFENSNLKKISIIAVVGSAIYYLIFIKLLGIFDPGFKILDILRGN